MGCDILDHWFQALSQTPLSVSSNGSNGLRQRILALSEQERSAFSILERIEWAATDGGHERSQVVSLFQYPRTDRMGCDPSPPSAPDCVNTFQYPRTDRMGCDVNWTT